MRCGSMTGMTSFLLAAIMASCGGKGGESKACDTCPETSCNCLEDAQTCGEVEEAVEDQGQEQGQDQGQGEDVVVPPPECKKGKVQCASGETDIYGVCVKDAEVAFAGGQFTMGVKDQCTDCPPHDVTLSPFAADRTEVSNRVFRACVDCAACTPPSRDGSFSGREPYYGNPEFDDYPVIYVTWEQAAAFCTGLGKRLPTEAEWEFMARGVEGRLYPWGSANPKWELVNANYYMGDTTKVTDQAAGATPEGVLNLAGNVWDWVFDVYQADYYANSPSKDPKGPEEGFFRVVRGGSFGSPLTQVKGHVRNEMFALDSYSNVGFRCVY